MEGPRIRMSYRKGPPPVQPVVSEKGVRMLVPIAPPPGRYISFKPDRISPAVHLDYLMAVAEMKIKHVAGTRVGVQFWLLQVALLLFSTNQKRNRY